MDRRKQSNSKQLGEENGGQKFSLCQLTNPSTKKYLVDACLSAIPTMLCENTNIDDLASLAIFLLKLRPLRKKNVDCVCAIVKHVIDLEMGMLKPSRLLVQMLMDEMWVMLQNGNVAMNLFSVNEKALILHCASQKTFEKFVLAITRSWLVALQTAEGSSYTVTKWPSDSVTTEYLAILKANKYVAENALRLLLQLVVSVGGCSPALNYLVGNCLFPEQLTSPIDIVPFIPSSIQSIFIKLVEHAAEAMLNCHRLSRRDFQLAYLILFRYVTEQIARKSMDVDWSYAISTEDVSFSTKADNDEKTAMAELSDLLECADISCHSIHSDD